MTSILHRAGGLACLLAAATACASQPSPVAPVSDLVRTGLWVMTSEIEDTSMFVRENPLRIAAEPETRFVFGGYLGTVAPDCRGTLNRIGFGPVTDVPIGADGTFSVDYESEQESSAGRYSATTRFHASGRFDSATTASGVLRIDHPAMTYRRTDGTLFNVCPAGENGPIAYSRTITWTATAR